MNRQNKKKDPTIGLMTVSDVARYLSLSEKTIYRMVHELPAVRVGGRWRFRVSDLDGWLLRRRAESEPLPEPVSGSGVEIRLLPYIRASNIFLDVAQTDAKPLLASALARAELDLTESPGEAARQRILDSILEREELCSTALDPAVAFPHPREPEKCPLASDRILIVRAASPVDFREMHGYRPRLVFILLARSAAVQLLWEARLSHLLHREGIREELLTAQSPEEVCDLFARIGQVPSARTETSISSRAPGRSDLTSGPEAPAR
jgi:excisionase family DNA binding protein